MKIKKMYSTLVCLTLLITLISTTLVVTADEYPPQATFEFMVSPSTQNVDVGETFTVDINIDPDGLSQNSISTDLLYWDTGMVKLTGLDLNESLGSGSFIGIGENIYSGPGWTDDEVSAGENETSNNSLPYLLNTCSGDLTYVSIPAGDYELYINGHFIVNASTGSETEYNLTNWSSAGVPLDKNYIAITVNNWGSSAISGPRLYMLDSNHINLGMGYIMGEISTAGRYATLTFEAIDDGTCGVYIGECATGDGDATNTTNGTVYITYGDAPSVQNPSPSNGASGISPYLSTVSANLLDSDGDSMDWTIEASTGDSDSGSRTDGPISCSLSTPLTFSDTITWWVNVTDGHNPVNETYTFTTRSQYIPDEPTGFVATANDKNTIGLSWTKGTQHVDSTYVVAKQDSAPSDRSDGTELYNGTGTSTTHSGLDPEEHWYYRAWSYNDDDSTWSSTYDEDDTTTPANSPISFSNPNPTNGSSGVLTTISSISITITDPESGVLDYSIQCSNGDSVTQSSVSGGSKSLTISSGLSLDTTYTWWVNATDDEGTTTREWFTFHTMANQAPTFSTEQPSDGAIDVPITRDIIQLDISDPEGDTFDWNIDCSNGDSSSGSGESNGTKTCDISSALDFGTTYTWWVNSSDTVSGLSTNESYTFTTLENSAVTAFAASADNRFNISLSWNAPSTSDSVLIESNSIASWSRGTGTEIYNNTGTSYQHTGLDPDTTVYYRAWSWNETKRTWSTASTATDTTDSNTAPSVDGGYPSPDTENISVAFDSGNITISDAESDLMDLTIRIGENLSSSQIVYTGSGLADGTYDFSIYSVLGKLDFLTEYTIFANIYDGYDWTNETASFTTGGILINMSLYYLNSTKTGYNYFTCLNISVDALSLGESLIQQNVSWEYISYWDSSEQRYSDEILINTDGTISGISGSDFTAESGDVILIAMLENVSFQYYGFDPTTEHDTIGLDSGTNFIGRTGYNTTAYRLGENLTAGSVNWTQILYYDAELQSWSNAFINGTSEGHPTDFTITTGMGVLVATSRSGSFMMRGW